MGLDIIEVIMAVEERFGISIPDDVGEELWTVGGLHLFVMRKLQEVYPADLCVTSSTFYALRRGLIKVSRLKRGDIQPDLDLREAIPFFSRRHLWPQLRRESGLPLPALEWDITFLVTIGLLVAGLLLWLRFVMDGPWNFSLLLCLAAGGFLLLLAIPFRASFPRQCCSLRQLVNQATPKGEVLASQGTWDSEKVWLEIQEIVSRQLGVERGKVTREANWKQLGAD